MDLKELGKELGSPERKREIEEKERREKMKEKMKKDSGKAPKKEKNVSYVGAPYNFVSFPDQVYEYERNGCKRLPSHGELGKEKESYTGEILYRIEPVTPIFVGGGTAKPQKGDGQKQEFYKNCEGRYAIPGNSVRGLLRSNVQVLSCSSMADDIEDYSIMYRAVAGGYNSQRYKQILNAKGKTLGKVKAGYLCKEKDSYYIYPTVLNGQYYTLSERTLITEYLNLKDKTQWTFPKLLSESHNELQHEAEKFNRVVNINRDGEEKISYVGTHNQNFIPHFSKISYTLKGKEITGIEEEGVLERQGCVHFSGWIGKKKAFYVIPQIDKSPEKAVKLDEKDIKSFQVDFAAKEKQLKGLGKRERFPDESQSDFEKGEKQRKDKIAAFFSLPGEGEEKPVFYVQGENRVYFGFTPHLRVFYDQSIHAGFPKGYQTDKIDYAKALFGYSKGQRTYRSRLSFTDAVLEEHAKYKNYNGKGNQKKYILSAPKPSSYKDYLKPKRGKGVVSYNGDFDLRGLKQYWLHKWAEKSTQVDNEAVATEIPALEVQSGGFVGKIRYKNLSEEELGLILWALKLRETSWQNIGKGKPYGFGRIKVQIRQVKRLDCERAYGLEGLEWDPMCDITEETEALIQKYKEMIKERYRVDIDKKAHVKEFFLMKESILPADKIQYMSVQNDYHTNRKVLPSVEELALAKEDTRK